MAPTILRVDYSNPDHGADLLAMLEIYANDPMGGNGDLSVFTRENLIAGLAKTPHAMSLLAYFQGKPVGLANCFFGFSTFAAQPLINIHDVVTHPDHRGEGVATALFETIENIAAETGCCKVTLEVLSDNHKATTLYSRLGYAGYALPPALGTALFWQKRIAA